MSLTALFWSTLYCAAIVLSLVNPLFAALGYLLEYYMRPELKWWGDELPDLRYNLIISVVLGVTFLLRRSSLREMAPVPNTVVRWLVAQTAVMLLVNSTVALEPLVSWYWLSQWVKMAIIFPMLVAGVVRSRWGFNLFVAAHLLGALWWGWDAWVEPRRSEGRLSNIGSGDSFSDNGASAHLLTVLPFALIYLFTERDIRLRSIAAIATPFVVNTIVLCNSRGSTVGILAALSAAFYLVRTGYRLRLVGAAIGAISVFLFLADPQFIARQQSTANYQEDGSAQQRLETWRAGVRLAIERPLGSGGRGFHILSPVYIPDIVQAHEERLQRGTTRAPHNTYVMVAAEWGILGLICLLGAYGAAFAMLSHVKNRELASADGFFYWRALAIQLALIAFLVAACFSDRLYAEAGYWMVGLAYALRRIHATEEADAAQNSKDAVEPASAPVRLTWPLADARSR
ncbi:MAG: O-antigen ligase family protein [Acidobacteriota bacterium]